MSSYLKFRDWLDIEGKDQFFGSANRGAKECYRVCQTQWDFASEDSDPVSLKLRRDARLMLEQLPQFIGAWRRVLQDFRPRAAHHDDPRPRALLPQGDGRHQDGSQTDMGVYVEELAGLRVRWNVEKRKRVGVLMDRAGTYTQEGALQA